MANGHSYVATIVPAGIDWFDAGAAAEARGGYLAAITSAAENQLVAGLITDPAFWTEDEFTNAVGPWIGGFQGPGADEPLGDWQWASGEPWGYSNWIRDEPNEHGNEDAVEFFQWGFFPPNDEWNDAIATNLNKGYVAEFDPASLAQVEGTMFRDVCQGSTGRDVIAARGGDDVLIGADGNDKLKGGRGDDRVLGGAGADTLLGEADDDTLIGGAGNDRLNGGAGNDVFEFSPGSGTDRILRFGDVAGNQDLIKLHGFGLDDFGDLSIRQSGANAVIDLGADRIILVGFSAANLDAADVWFG